MDVCPGCCRQQHLSCQHIDVVRKAVRGRLALRYMARHVVSMQPCTDVNVAKIWVQEHSMAGPEAQHAMDRGRRWLLAARSLDPLPDGRLASTEEQPVTPCDRP